MILSDHLTLDDCVKIKFHLQRLSMFSSNRSKFIAGTVAIGGLGAYYALQKYRRWSADIKAKLNAKVNEKIQNGKILALKCIAAGAISVAAYCWLDMKLSRTLLK